MDVRNWKGLDLICNFSAVEDSIYISRTYIIISTRTVCKKNFAYIIGFRP